jgi:AraC-like DNA-binding protein
MIVHAIQRIRNDTMQVLHIILQLKAGRLRIADRLHATEGPALLFVVGTAAVSTDDAVHHSFTAATVQSVYRDLQHLLSNRGGRMETNQPHSVPADAKLIDAAELIAEADPEAMLRFALTYCLAVDRDHCAAMLHWMVNGDHDLFDFIEAHRLQPWPVSRYADELGLTLRKFNQLFQEKYGISAKSWLLEERIKYAKELLQTTSSKVTDIAIEVGFSTHAHFCDSFKRRYGISPTDLRKLEPASYRRSIPTPATSLNHEHR